jgi:Rrf2 family protein
MVSFILYFRRKNQVKLLTRDTDYAVRALLYFARNGNHIVSVKELVEEIKMPWPFLRKILQILHKRQFVEAFKGRGGGFILSVLPQDIFLVDLIEIFQGPFKLSECIFKKRICPDINSCILRQRMNEIERKVIAELKTITIASLL